MRCINSPAVTEEVIKKSRFLGFIYPCLSEDSTLAYLHDLRNEHSGANHIVFAYRIRTDQGIVCRFYDAGEPSGTAGKPIYQYIEGNDLINVLIVVVRYFGGIKLGAGGLTRAYGNTAKQVIEVADITEFIELASLHFTLDYKDLQHFEYQLAKCSGIIISKDFAGQVNLVVQLPVVQAESLLALFSGYIL
ncbi:MAG: IMPACT family protein [Methylococcaceae bacterium]|nr:IMPACT family protein [Methylococcaceae bacterium]